MNINEVLNSPDVTHFFANVNKRTNTNLDDKRRKKKPKVSSIQDKYFTKPSKNKSHTSSDSKDLDDYLKKVEKKYHEIRKKEWEKAYKENYKTRYPKDGEYPAKL